MSRIVQVYLVGDGPQVPRKQLVGIYNGNREYFNIHLDPFWLRRYNEKTGEMELPKHGTPLHLLVGLSSNDKNAIKIISEYSE